MLGNKMGSIHNFQLMFDCDGGLTMCLFHGENLVYVNYYDDMEQAAAELREFFTLDYSIQLWDGNMLDDEDFDPYYLEFNAEAERNGSTFWAMSIEDIKKSTYVLTWNNLQDFIKAWES